MNLRRVWSVARKEFVHVLRDPRSMGMAVAIPMLLLLLFGYALTLDVDNVPMVIWDQSQTPASRDLVSRFLGSPYFSLRKYVDNYRDLEHAIDAGDALVGLVLPYNFDRHIAAMHPIPVQLIVDGSDANTATITIGYAEAITQIYSQEEVIERDLKREGITYFPIPLDVRSRVWFNPDLESRNYIIPGLIAVIMMIIAALLTSLTVAREWEQGTMEQLISTPVRGHELIFGKLVPYFAIGLLDVLLAVLMAEYLFRVPLRGNVALLFGMASIFLIGALAMGLTISIVAKSQLLASQMAMTMTFVPAYLLSGFMFSIVNMPKVVQLVTYLIPARYFVALLKGIYLRGVGLELMVFDATLLTVFGIVMVLVANLTFKKKLT
ncbi:MAG: ABC transporter permease [Thermoguttaceae bacterium]|jgi:ABC-2 type transport system permease protein